MKIVLFNGPPRSGKDTATKFAMEFVGMGGKQYRFAAPLKNATHRLFGLSGDTEAYDAVKEIPNPDFLGMSPREAYIWMSEECAKPKFGRDFFTRVAINAIKSYGQEFTIISDCGFKEEAAGMIDEFGKDNVIIVHLLRDGKTYKDDSRGYITDVGCKVLTIENNGELYELKRKVEMIIESFISAK